LSVFPAACVSFDASALIPDVNKNYGQSLDKAE